MRLIGLVDASVHHHLHLGLGPGLIVGVVIVATTLAVMWLRGGGRLPNISTYLLKPRGVRPENLETMVQGVSAALGWAGKQKGSYTIGVMRQRTHDEQAVLLTIGAAQANLRAGLADQLAKAVGASATTVSLTGLSLPKCLATTRRGEWVGIRQAQTPDPFALADSLASRLDADGETFVALGALEASRYTARSIRKWGRVVARTHNETNPYANSNEPVLVAKAVAGAPSASEAEGLLGSLGVLLPEWGFEVTSIRLTDRLVGAVGLALGAVPGVLGVLTHQPGLIGLSIPITLGGLVLVVMGGDRLSARHYRKHLLAGLVPVRPHMALTWRPQRKAGPDNAPMEPEMPLFPLAAGSLPFTARHLTVFLCPATSRVQGMGGLKATERIAPTALRQVKGGLLGLDPENNPVRIADSDRSGGIFFSGDPGTGKSTVLLSLWASDILAWKAKRNRHLWWIETKGEGAIRAIRAAQAMGVSSSQVIHLNTAQDKTHYLDLLGKRDPETANTRAVVLASAMRYAFGPGDIVARSVDIIASVMSLALACELPEGISPFVAAALLCGFNEGRWNQAEMWSWFSRQRGSHPQIDLALDNFERYMSLSVTQRKNEMSAPLNKFTTLLREAPLLFRPNPGARPVSILQLLRGGHPVVVNFGGLPAHAAEAMPAMFLYLFWEAIRSECEDWQERGRMLCVFTDELSVIAGKKDEGAKHEAEIVEEMLSKGRSYGVCAAFATQRYTQIPALTLSAVLSMTTKGYLRAENPYTARQALEDLNSSQEVLYNENDIRSLPKFTTIIRTRANGEALPPFTMHVINDAQLSPSLILDGPPRVDLSEAWESKQVS